MRFWCSLTFFVCLRVFVCLPVASSFIVLCFFHSVSVFMFTVYCLMDPCGLISNKDDDNGPESFHRHFNAQFTSSRPTFFFGIRLYNNRQLSISALKIWTLLRLLLLLNTDDSNVFPSLADAPTAVILMTAFLRRPIVGRRLQLCCSIRFIDQFQRLKLLSALILRLHSALRLVCNFGILRAEH